MGFVVKKVLISVRLFATEKYAKTSIKCLKITLSLSEKSKKLNNKKLLTCCILSFSNFKLLFSSSDTLNLWIIFFARRSKGVISNSSIYYCHFFVLFLSTELQLFFMHNKYILRFLLTFDLVSFFLFALNNPLQVHQSFVFYERKKCMRRKQLNDTMS